MLIFKSSLVSSEAKGYHMDHKERNPVRKKSDQSFFRRFFLEISRVNFRSTAGFAFCQAWFALCLFDSRMFPEDLTMGIYELSLATCATSLIPCLFMAQRFEKLFQNAKLTYVLALFATLGALAVPLTTLFGVDPHAQQLLTGILIGFPAGWLFMVWYQVFAIEKDYTGLILSIVLSSVIMYAVSITSELLPLGRGTIAAAAALAPLASAALFIKPKPDDSFATYFHFPKKKTKQYRVLVLLCCGIFAIILAHGFMRKYFFSSLGISFHASGLNFLLLIVKLTCLAIIISMRSGTEHRVSVMYRTVCILTVIGVLLMPYTKSSYYFLYGIIDFGAFVLNLMTLLIAYVFYHQYRVSYVLVFALIRIVYCATLFAGVILSRLYHYMLPTIPDLLGIVSISLGLLIFAICLYIFTEKGSTLFLPKQEPENTSTTTTEKAYMHLIRKGNLSKREADVFLLVAKGRSTPRIQEEMHLSTNTINTHIQHIYQKLDVHSRQELLDIIEEEGRNSSE